MCGNTTGEILMIKNAKTLPKVYFGLHMLPGVAEYEEQGQKPYRIFLNEQTIKKMDPSFQGRPVYVGHVGKVEIDQIQEADGYVVRSFYNKADGKHWAEFIVVSDKGHEAISKGWRLSNAYFPREFGSGGLWNGVQYEREVVNGEYEHLALVPNPRYDESIILNPEQFKEYNLQKEKDLARMTNSSNKGANKMSVMKFFKKEKIENGADIESMSVILPESKKEVTISEAIKLADKFENMHGYANGDHMVKVGEDEMSVNDMVKECMKMREEKKANEVSAEEAKKKAENEADLDGGEKKAEADKKEADKTENKGADLDGGEKQAEKDKKSADKTENAANKEDFFETLKNAPLKNTKAETPIDLDKSARGKSRYGSGK